MNISLKTNRPVNRIKPNKVSTKELYKQAEIEGDTPYSDSNQTVFSILGGLVGGPKPKRGPEMTRFQRKLRKLGISGKKDAGDIKKSLTKKMLKGILKGASVFALGVGLVAAGVALAPLSTAAAVGSGLVLMAPGVITAAKGVSDITETSRKHGQLKKQTNELATNAAERLDLVQQQDGGPIAML